MSNSAMDDVFGSRLGFWVMIVIAIAVMFFALTQLKWDLKGQKDHERPVVGPRPMPTEPDRSL